MATYLSVNERRKRYWLKNAVRYRLMRLARGKRDNGLWLFSAWEGRKYSDNARALYEYMLREHPEIRCIWQTREENVYNSLMCMGYPVQLIGTREAEESQKHAGVVLYTNGLDDFGDYPYIYGAMIVSLWHGVGFKKVYRLLLDSDAVNLPRRILGNMKWSLFSWVKRDLTIATSQYNAEQFCGYFNLPANAKISITGQARNDAMKADADVTSIISKKEVQNWIRGKRIILYMPTFRQEPARLLKQIEMICNDHHMETTLDERNAVFVSKMHYLNRGSLQSSDRYIFLNDEDVQDVQQLLCCADLLITDYSSCAMDYALLGKPVLHFIPDWEDYRHTVMDEAGEVLFINCAQTPEELVWKIAQTLDHPEYGIRQSEVINEFFAVPNVKIGSFCEKTYQEISKHLRN